MTLFLKYKIFLCSIQIQNGKMCREKFGPLLYQTPQLRKLQPITKIKLKKINENMRISLGITLHAHFFLRNIFSL